MKTLLSDSDNEAIAEAMEKFYFHGIYEGDLSLLRQVFHPGTLLFGDVNGQPYAKNLEQYLDGISNRVSPRYSGKPYETEIISIDMVNSIATVKARVKMYDFNYLDLLSFHKIGNQWVIVNKMLTNVGS
jgi:hypothetical protein